MLKPKADTQQSKVLLSAFACSPCLGSEAGVGWRWALEIAKLGYEVTVLTSGVYRGEIEPCLDKLPELNKPKFTYVDAFGGANYQSSNRVWQYVYLYLWQFLAVWRALKLHKEIRFDMVHHITFGGIRYPSFLGALGIPFIVGPIGGGECAPKQLRKSYPLRGKIVDAVRDLWNALVPFDPILRLQFSQASLILIKTPDNIALVPKFARWKVQQLFEIGIDRVPKPVDATKTKNPTVLFAGRCQFWKGMHLGIGAIAQAMIALPDLTLTIAGDGPERDLWERQASVLGIAHRVTWLGWQPKDALDALYQSHHLVLFPSLHDSSGNVVLEASIRGTPVVCLDCGGPGALLPSTAGVKIPVQSRTENEVVDMMAAALKHYLSAPAELEKLAKTAEEWAREQTWASRVVAAYADFTPTRNGGA